MWNKSDGEHKYVSTACQHDRHHLCRLTCKYCDGVCRCKKCKHSEMIGIAKYKARLLDYDADAMGG